MFLNPNNLSNLNSNCFDLLDLRNLQQKSKKVFSFQKLLFKKNCSSDLKLFATSRPSASNFKCFSQSLEQFFLTVCQNKFGDKIPISMNLTFFSHYPRSSISSIFHKNAGTYMKIIMLV